MPWSWKTTLWKVLAQQLSYSFIDFDDDIIEQIEQKSVAELAKELSLEQFQNLEEKHALALNFSNTVLSSSGSLPYSEKAMLHLKSIWTVIYLKVDVSEIKQRLSDMKTERIIELRNKSFWELFIEREHLYETHADIVFSYSGSNIKGISNNLSTLLWTR